MRLSQGVNQIACWCLDIPVHIGHPVLNVKLEKFIQLLTGGLHKEHEGPKVVPPGRVSTHKERKQHIGCRPHIIGLILHGVHVLTHKAQQLRGHMSQCVVCVQLITCSSVRGSSVLGTHRSHSAVQQTHMKYAG